MFSDAASATTERTTVPRRPARTVAEGGADNLAHLRRSWPQLADELEALAATLALPVREAQTSQPATRGATEGCAPASRER